MEVPGLSQAEGAKRRESHAVGEGVIASLAPHFHGEEALRKKSWVFFAYSKHSILPGPCPTLDSHLQGGSSLLRLCETPLCFGPYLCGSPFSW